MNDIAAFETEYKARLDDAIAAADMPAELLAAYAFESCIRKDRDGKKELYLVTRKADGAKAFLRSTFHYPEEDALEEAKLLAKLDHPAIPKVYATHEQAGRHYIVRAYIEGHSLQELVKSRGPLPVKDIYGIVLKLCDVLQYLHGLTPPLIHRDIKPQNIILATDGSIHLIDFGIARVHKEGQSRDTAIVLTGRYAPPEQYGYDQTSPLTDIYALGVVMLFLATGREEKTGLDVQIRDKTLRRLIEGCIAFDPHARIQSVAGIAQYIKRHTGLKKTRRRALLVLLLLTVIACAAAPAYYFGQRAGKAVGQEAGYHSGYEAGFLAAPDWSLPEIPFDARNGNLTGNMNNGGFVARSEDAIIYLCDNALFAMNPDGSGARLLARYVDAKKLCYYKGAVYYTSPRGVDRMDLATGDIKNLGFIAAETLYICDDSIYFENGADWLTLYRMDLNGGNIEKMNDIRGALYLNIAEDRMVFAYEEDGRKLYSCKLDGSDLRQLSDGPCEWPCVYEERIYVRQTDRNGNNGVLLRMNLDGTGRQVLLDESPSCIVAVQGGVFYTSPYTKEDGRTLEWISPDGKLRFTILKGNIGSFNLAGEWIFYENRDDDGALWRVRLDGAENQRVA